MTFDSNVSISTQAGTSDHLCPLLSSRHRGSDAGAVARGASTREANQYVGELGMGIFEVESDLRGSGCVAT